VLLPLKDSHGVQSGAANALCNLAQSHTMPQCTPIVFSKQHVELFHTDMRTLTGVFIHHVQYHLYANDRQAYLAP